MNETLKLIYSRRSIRHFKTDQINDADIKEILKAAMHAPSAQNLQPWHFTVIQNKALMDRMVEITKNNMRKSGIPFLLERISAPSYHTYFRAPTIILVSGNEKGMFTDIDCGLAAGNILLAAESLGISSLIMTFSGFLFRSEDSDSIKKELGIPEGYRHVCTIALGYREGVLPGVPERNEDVVNFIR